MCEIGDGWMNGVGSFEHRIFNDPFIDQLIGFGIIPEHEREEFTRQLKANNIEIMSTEYFPNKYEGMKWKGRVIEYEGLQIRRFREIEGTFTRESYMEFKKAYLIE